MTRNTTDPAAASAPVSRRAARATEPGRPAVPGAPHGTAGGKTSSQPSERQAVRTPGPETAPAPPLLGQEAVRARDTSPAGASLKAHGSHPAGSTRALFIDVQDTERAARERARRADSRAFLDAHLAGKMTEAELEEQIRDACTKLGILRFHVRISIGTTAGLPDDILIGPGGILWRECKTAKGKVTAAQQEAGAALTAAGQDWAVWRPADWYSGRIQRELAGLAGIRGETG